MIVTATVEQAASPPYIRIDLDTEDPNTTFTAITIRRNGELVRALAPVGSTVSVAYDYDAPYDVALTYTVEAQTVTQLPGFTETWPNISSWTSTVAGWSAASGKAVSSTDGATIVRAVGGILGSLQSLDVDWTTVQLIDDLDNLIVEVKVLGTYAELGGGFSSAVSPGSGAFSLIMSDGVATLTGDGYETVSNPYYGDASKVRLITTLGPPLELLAFQTLDSSGKAFSPVDMAVTSGGDIWAVDYYGHKIRRYNSAGVLQQTVGSNAGSADGQFRNPVAITIDGSGNLFVTDAGNHRIQAFTSAGVYAAKFGTFGTGNGQFNNPGQLVLDSSNNFFVADYGNNRIQKFNSLGVYQSQFGTLGTGNGQFHGPFGITRDSSNNLYVTDDQNNRVQKFNSAGTYQTQWGSLGAGPGQFNSPSGIEADSSNNIYVADYNNNRVQKFSNVGAFLYEGGGFNLPWSVAVDSSANVYVANTNANEIRKYESHQQTAVVDDVTATIAPAAPVAIVGSDTVTLLGLAAWLIHPTTPDLSVQIDSGCDGYVAQDVDDFQRANNATSLGSTSTGKDWEVYTGVWGIDTNKAYVSTGVGGNYSMAVLDGSADGTIEVTISTFASNSYSGIAARTSDANNQFTFRKNDCAKFVGGVGTFLGTYTDDLDDGDRMRVVLDGPSIKVYKQVAAAGAWIEVFAVTDSDNLTNTKHGLTIYDTAATNARFDDYSFTYATADSGIYVTEVTSQSMTHPAGNRSVLEIEGASIPVVVSTGPRRIPDRVLELHSIDFDTRDIILNALASADPILLRSPAAWDLDMPEGWFSVGDVPYLRDNAPAISQENTLTLQLTPVRTPVIEPSFGRTYADELVAGGTYGDAVASGRSYLERLTG